jgi:hypothetical protein
VQCVTVLAGLEQSLGMNGQQRVDVAKDNMFVTSIPGHWMDTGHGIDGEWR